ncbi:MAG: PKD domain-containing protein, partial [Nitrospiraceae bacterium]|nr:PKD domain-containing protein [Nitrospiraceae bacterium]
MGMAALRRGGWQRQVKIGGCIAFLIALLAAFSGCGPFNHSPVAVISANPTSGQAPLEVSFDASRSYDSDGRIISYAWKFGDGSSGSGVTATHTYNSQGTYVARLTVTDNEGATGSASVTIAVSPSAAPSFTYDRENAIKYAETWCGHDSDKPNAKDKRNDKCHNDKCYKSYKHDCANFVSQCLIAGGLGPSIEKYIESGRCPPDKHDDKCIISCTYLQDYLVNYLGARHETRSAGEKEPDWFKPGDVAIFPTPKHAVFAVGYYKQHLVYNDHFSKGDHCGIRLNDEGKLVCKDENINVFFRRDWPHCTYYHIPGEPSPNQPTTVTITAPADGSTFSTGDTITFQGSATDPEDGPLTGACLVWTSSIDGQIGTGESFTRSDLSVGTHTITLTATDSQGARGAASVTITVTTPPGPAKGKIAFASDRDGDSEIYVMNADGSDQHNISNAPDHWDWGPAWSPDGTKIAFTSNRDGNYEVYIMNADGSDQHNISNDPDRWDWGPAWSPDGTKI